MLSDVTNRPLPRRDKQEAQRRAPPPTATAVDAAQPQPGLVGLEQVDDVLRSFRRLDFQEGPLLDEEDEQQQQQAADAAAVAPACNLQREDSAASSATASSSRLGSPLAAFAAAKARLARSTGDADALIATTLQRLGQQPPAALEPPAPAPEGGNAGAPCAAASAAAASPPRSSRPALDPSLMARAPRVRPASAAAGALAVPARGTNQLLQHQRHHALLLKERLNSTMQLCQSLHEQNQANMARVKELWADNQRLSHSLQEARLDKEALQQTIRQLTQEAALLAEQARRALLPGATQPAAARPAAAPPARPASAPAAPSPIAAAAAAAGAPKEAAEWGLVRDWSQAPLSTASSSGSGGGGSGAGGAAWQPGASVGGFCCGAASAYEQSGEADKRRRLAPGMLAHCLKPVVAAAIAEAADSPPAGRLGTPGRTPKRKLPPARVSVLAAATAQGAVPAAAADPASPAQQAQQQQQFVDAAAEAAAGPGSQAVGAPPAPAQEAAPAAGAVVAAQQAGAVAEQEFFTFELLDSKWHGGAAKAPPAHALALPRPAGSRSHGGVCSIM